MEDDAKILENWDVGRNQPYQKGATGKEQKRATAGSIAAE